MSEWAEYVTGSATSTSTVTVTASAGIGFQIEAEGFFASANNNFEWLLKYGTRLVASGFGLANTTAGALFTHKKTASDRDQSATLQVLAPGSSKIRATIVFNRVSSR